MVLALLSEAPMHPYEMQRLMVARGDDRMVRVQRGSLYPAVERLEAAGLVEHDVTEREGRRPERTVYRITDEGRRTAVDWLIGMLSSYRDEFPELGAAMSFVGLIDSATFAGALSGRLDDLTHRLARLDEAQTALTGRLPRVFILENEYLAALYRAEHAFLSGLVADVGAGRLSWDKESIERWYNEVGAAGFPDAAVVHSDHPAPPMPG